MIIEGWFYIYKNNCIWGYIQGKEGIDPTIMATTSPIVEFDEVAMTVKTKSGSIYKLGVCNNHIETEIKYLRACINGKS